MMAIAPCPCGDTGGPHACVGAFSMPGCKQIAPGPSCGGRGLFVVHGRGCGSPRSRGEQACAVPRLLQSNGSSPRVRGTGGPSPGASSRTLDHPRWRGEQSVPRPESLPEFRIISAYAGNSRTVSRSSLRDTGSSPLSRGASTLPGRVSSEVMGHPRRCGEQSVRDLEFPPKSGIIPAGAGNTGPYARSLLQALGHPRYAGSMDPFRRTLCRGPNGIRRRSGKSTPTRRPPRRRWTRRPMRGWRSCPRRPRGAPRGPRRWRRRPRTCRP